MKRFLLTLAGVILMFIANAQQPGYCGTDMPEDMIHWLTAHQAAAAKTGARQGGPGTVYYIPVKVHVVGDDNGAGYHKTQTILDGLCTLNEQYEQVGFHFYLFGDFNYINHTGLYEHTGGVNSTVNATKSANAANIYYVLDPDGNCGYFSGGSRDFIAVAKSCSGPTNSTVAHELGHYFSMPHTFFGWESRDPNTASATAFDERVNGTNCLTAGDRFCDTPADYLSDRWSCPYNKTKLDYNGDQYQVDGSLFMSYANDACQDKFSPEQINAMRSYLLSARSNLLSQPQPAKDSVGLTTVVYPPDGSNGIPANFTQLRWRKVAGATRYHVLLTRFFNGSFYEVDTVVQDTTILLSGLQPNVNYRWKIKAFNEGYTCAEYTILSNFVTSGTSTITPTFSINDISCHGHVDGAIQVTAAGGVEPYTYAWSNGATDSNLQNLEEGNYRLTITDSDSNSVQLQFSVSEPEPMNAEVNYNGSTIIVSASGGTPPYFYQWSNGSTSSVVTSPEAGNYSITITDSKGCIYFKDYLFTGVEEIIAGEAKIYPNPFNNEQLLSVEFSTRESFIGSIEIYEATGRKVWSLEKEFATGNNREMIALPEVASGIYLVRISGDRFQVTNRLMVF